MTESVNKLAHSIMRRPTLLVKKWQAGERQATASESSQKRRRRQLLMEPAAEECAHEEEARQGKLGEQEDDSFDILRANGDNIIRRATTTSVIPVEAGRPSLFAKNNKQQQGTRMSSEWSGEQEGEEKRWTISGLGKREQRKRMTISREINQQQRARRKSELTTFLTILFGSIALLLLIRLAGGSGLAGTNVGASPKQANSPFALDANTTVPSDANTVPKASLAASAEEEHVTESSSSSADDHDADDDERAQDNSLNSTDSHGTKLAELISDAAGSGADLLVERLQGGGSERTAAAASNEAESLAPDEFVGAEEESAQAEDSPRHNHNDTRNEQEEQLKLAMQTYARWRSTSDDIIELFSRKLLPLIIEHGYDVDPGTAAGLLTVFNGIRAIKPWALKLLDASAKLAPGILVGTQSDFGDFDECLNIKVDDPSGLATNNPDYPVEVDPETGLRSTTLVGRYCLADVEFPKPPRESLSSANGNSSASRLISGLLRSTELPIQNRWAPIELRRPLLNFSESAAYKETIFVETGNFFHMLYVDPIRVGLCLTNRIDPENFAKVFNKLFEELRVTINFRGRCVTKYDRPQWSEYQRISAYILSVASSLVAMSTIFELLERKLQSWPVARRKWPGSGLELRKILASHRALLTSFSIIRNTKRLFKPQAAPLTSHTSDRSAASSLLPAAAYSSSFSSSSSLAASCNGRLATLGDSSVESSPSIERRMSASIDGGSSVELMLNEQQAAGSRERPLGPVAPAAEFAACLQPRDKGRQQQQETSGKGAGQAADINLLCLHGIRVITMTWMIVNHTYMFGGFFVLWAHRRLIDIAEWPKSLSFQLVLNGWLTVETYFFLSALIIVLNVLPLMRAKHFNYFSYIIHRLLRLLPAYIGLVCLNFLWPLISSGPVWLVKGKSFVQKPCEDNLWTNFLFINNWIWPEKQCMVHTWFLSADFQLYLLAPIVVYLLYRRPVLGHSLNLLIAVLASIFSGLVIYANELLPTTLINKLEFDAIKQQLSYSYFATYQHMGPYCLGILTGYVLHKRPRIKLPNHLTCLLWLLLPPLSFTTLMLTYLWNGAHDDAALLNPSPLVSALYVAIHRIIWTSLVAWLVFACSTGRARMLSSFLSHPIFIPISRLSYSIYLVHLPVIMFRALNLRHTIEWSDQNILWEACGNFIASIVMGYFLNIVFESPIINLESVLFGCNKGGQVETQQRHHNLPQTIGANFKSLEKQQDKEAKRLVTAASESKTDECEYDDKSRGSGRAEATSSDLSEALNSSPEQERRQMSKANQEQQVAAPARTDRQSFRSNTKQWEQEEGRAASHRRLIRLKEASVEKVFGLAEPAISRSNVAEERAELSLDQRHRRRMQTRLLSNDDDIYNVDAEYRHYAPGAYQQWRLANGALSMSGNRPSLSRPRRYATLARTDRLSNSSNYTVSHYPSSELYLQTPNRQQMPPRQQEHSHSRLSALASSSFRLRHDAATSSYQIGAGLGPAARPMALSRHQGRYNTLTGAGARDWRLQYEPLPSLQADLLQARARQATARGQQQAPSGTIDDPYKPNWPRQFAGVEDGNVSQSIVSTATTTSALTPQSLSGNWLQAGAMIPRIDSSTLRRQARRSETAAGDSIVEEPADEESSAL